MNYTDGEHFDRLIRNLLQPGRYNNAGEVVRESLRLLEERESKRRALKDHLDTAIARGGSCSDWEIAESLDSI